MRRKAFSLIELLVVITIIVMLVAMMGAAMNSARASGKRQTTNSAIVAINAILQRHFASCESTPLTPLSAATADIGVSIRRKITADMPDHWEEVRYMKANPTEFKSARQRGYVATLNGINPTDELADAECLFMIVMQGGLADCLACTSLDSVRKGDTDVDGALEFWDAWGKPIRYVLWPGGFELPLGEKFFDQVPPFSGVPGAGATGGLMRPLVFSGGPDKKSTTGLHPDPDPPPPPFTYLSLGNACGDPADATIAILGAFVPDPLDPTLADYRPDNITNYDGEVKK